MVLTIAAIGAFQASWLRKNYLEEKRIFTIHSNMLFRETIFRLQASRLHLDTSFNVRVQDKSGIISMTNVLKAKIIGDSSGLLHRSKAFVISLRHDPVNNEFDSAGDVMYHTANTKVFDFLKGVDSLQGSITLKDVADSYKQNLGKEGIHLPFRITMTHSAGAGMARDTAADAFFPADGDANKVTVGFTRPEVFELNFDNLSWFIARRIGPQALFSLVLVGFTVLSFLLLYRNWQQQRRLTELKNDFISNMTHELKTPIATVSVAVEALQHFNALQDPVRTQEYLDISANELQRLSLMVDKVLKLSLFEMQEIELKNEHFDMKALAEEVMASMRLQFEKYEAKPGFATHGNDFYLWADKLHITSVIFNLLDNALKYSKPHPAIDVSLVAEADQLVLSVSDDGVGIPPAYREKIFEKFFRVPTGDKHNVKGYGLGLSYVSYVLKRHGGKISVESQLDVGSRFTIKIPRSHA